MGGAKGGTANGRARVNVPNASNEEPIVYVVRLRERATRDINAVYVWMAEEVSETVADEWYTGLYAALATLATMPRRCPLVPERFRGEVRQRLYQRSESRIKHRILFIVTGEETNSPEPPTVRVVHVRPASARPITRAQLRENEADT